MSGRFKPRPTRYVEISSIRGWRLKRYEITLDGQPIAADINAAVDAVLTAALPPVPAGELGVGFLTLHHGAESVWTLADLWTGDIISQHTFSASLDDPLAVSRVPAGGPTACVWELPIHGHERNAFVRHILDPATGPDVKRYLADTYGVSVASNRDLLIEFDRAWAAGDVDALMAVMSPTPIYRASTGDGPGTEYRGRGAVRAGFARVIEAEAVAGADNPAPPAGQVHVFGDRGLSFWSYVARDANGKNVRIEGVDVWTFADGRIAVKDAYRKAFPGP